MPIRPGDPVLVLLDDGSTFLLRPTPGAAFSTHHGQLQFDRVLEAGYGAAVPLRPGRRAVLLRPTIEDLMMKVERKTNIVYPKDAGFLLLRLGVRPGTRVLEVGTGSGSLLLALATAVSPDGQIVSYDRNEAHQAMARRNLERSGLAGRVELRTRDPAGGAFPDLPESFDCAVLDVAEPWEEVPWVSQALAPGGRLASLNPTFNQIERMGEALEAAGYVLIEGLEILFRRILVRSGRTRPAQQMIGHTEFLLFAARGPADGLGPPAVPDAEVGERLGESPP